MSDALPPSSFMRSATEVRPEIPAGRQLPPVQRSESSAAALGGRTSERPDPHKTVDLRQMREEIREAVDRLNEQMRKESRNLAFSVDEKVNQTIITIKNAQTGEVVRQIPDEALLHVAHSIEDMKGLLYDEVS